METPVRTVFYTIEKTIKSYRKFAQQNINREEPEITLDQALILMLINEDNSRSQKKISDLLFKDYASMTRMIDLMVTNGYLERRTNQQDRRKSRLALTEKGTAGLRKIEAVVQRNRTAALEGISPAEIVQLMATLNKITDNCQQKVSTPV